MTDKAKTGPAEIEEAPEAHDVLRFVRLGKKDIGRKEKIDVALFELVEVADAEEGTAASKQRSAFNTSAKVPDSNSHIDSEKLAGQVGISLRTRVGNGLTVADIDTRLADLEKIKDQVPLSIAALKEGKKQLVAKLGEPVVDQSATTRRDRAINSM